MIDISIRDAVGVITLNRPEEHNTFTLAFAEALYRMSDLFAELCAHPDAEEGVKAFLEKRKPEWMNG